MPFTIYLPFLVSILFTFFFPTRKAESSKDVERHVALSPQKRIEESRTTQVQRQDTDHYMGLSKEARYRQNLRVDTGVPRQTAGTGSPRFKGDVQELTSAVSWKLVSHTSTIHELA